MHGETEARRREGTCDGSPSLVTGWTPGWEAESMWTLRAETLSHVGHLTSPTSPP